MAANLADRLQLLKLGLEGLLSARFRAQTHPELFLGQGAVCERIDQPIEPLLDPSEFAVGLGAPLDL